jgi:hypothetical protein
MFIDFNQTRFVERDRPLARCPDGRCRRTGRCTPSEAGHPCHRLFAKAETMRLRLIRKLEKLAAESAPDDPPLSDEEIDRNLAVIKAGLMQREEDWFAEQRQKAEAARVAAEVAIRPPLSRSRRRRRQP